MTPSKHPGAQVTSYEGAEHPAYSELGGGRTFDQWGSCIVTRPGGEKEWRPYYSDPELTRRLFTNPILEQSGDVHGTQLVTTDFGGGDGTLLEQVRAQLTEAGADVTPVLIDIERKGKLSVASEKNPLIEPVQADLLDLPLKTGSVDIGISRHAIQYLPRPLDQHNETPEYQRFRRDVLGRSTAKNRGHVFDQSDFLRELYRVTKSGGTIDLVWPGAFHYGTEAERKRADAISYFWNGITGARITGEGGGERYADADSVSSERWFTAGEELARFAQRAGFEVVTAEECTDIEFRITPGSIMDRFDPKGNWSERQKQLIENCFERAGLQATTADVDVVDFNGEKAVRIPISRLLLKKR